MVKVVVNNAKGLVQYAGKSEMTVENQLVAEGLSGLRDAKTFRDPATSGAARTAVSIPIRRPQTPILRWDLLSSEPTGRSPVRLIYQSLTTISSPSTRTPTETAVSGQR
jgi:hypothetical protein